MFNEALSFTPIYQERVWGGQRLASQMGRLLPSEQPFGESWELVDRPEAQSVVDSGPLAGTPLHELWSQSRERVFGNSLPESSRFPLLMKLLDATDTLSVQVHPPAHAAARLRGEPKTEMWYILEATESAAVYAGFRAGVTRADFENALQTGGIEPLLHRIPVRAGDALFIPSGRCHAIGAGCLIAEVQQNSDTTYRVFDWNRTGLDGKPRALHIEESLASIDFADFEPQLLQPKDDLILRCELFEIRVVRSEGPILRGRPGAFHLVLRGSIKHGTRIFSRGQTFVLPAAAENGDLEKLTSDSEVLTAEITR